MRNCAARPASALEPAQNGRPVAAHLVGRLDRHAHLRLQRGRAAVPEELLAPGQIPQRGRVAPQRRARERARAPAPVGEGPLGLVAAGARALAGAGEARVGEQLGAERDLLRRQRIVGRSRRRAGRWNTWRHTAAASGLCATSGRASRQRTAAETTATILACLRGIRSHPRRYRIRRVQACPQAPLRRLLHRTHRLSWSGLPALGLVPWVPTIQPSACSVAY